LQIPQLSYLHAELTMTFYSLGPPPSPDETEPRAASVGTGRKKRGFAYRNGVPSLISISCLFPVCKRQPKHRKKTLNSDFGAARKI
jgi:hypothetical protein